MKKLSMLCWALALCLLLSGCDMWMNGTYVYKSPHQDDYTPYDVSQTAVSTQQELRRELSRFVGAGREDGVIYFTDLDKDQAQDYLDSEIRYLKTYDPVGAYALEEITCQLGTSGGRQAIAIKAKYYYSRSRILQIRDAADMEQAKQLAADALESFQGSVVMLVENYREMDFEQFTQEYVAMYPDRCMEQPQVTVSVYPEMGISRVVELSFTYQNTREELKVMQEAVEKVFTSAELYVSPDAGVTEKYFQLYNFLMERSDYRLETALTPAYHLLRHGVGDSKAFASVYAAMCRRVGLDCQMVSGTRNGEPWWWNVIAWEDAYYYLDLLACSEKGRFAWYTQEKMKGYVWNWDQYQTPPA